MSGDRSDSLFSSDKESLGEGWGKPTAEEEPALAPVDWTKLPDAPDPNKKKVRARLATPAPGSQKESGLLDIKALAGAMQAEKDAEASGAGPKPSAPSSPGGARLATSAKGSGGGSGLIDVGDLVRATEGMSSESSGGTPVPASESSAGTSSSSASMSGPSSASMSGMEPSPSLDDDDDDDLVQPSGGRMLIYLMLGVLTLAVAGLAYYVLTQR